MKKNKWLALLLAAMMALGMAGCGGGDDNSGTEQPSAPPVVEETDDIDFVGDWACIGYEYDGQELAEEDCGESWIALYDNYTVETLIMDQYYEGDWDFTESGIVLYLYDGGYEEEIYCDMVEDVMYMDYQNMYTLFMKAE